MKENSSISLRVSLTERCQLRCQYCRPAHTDQHPPGPFLAVEEWFRRIQAVHRAGGVEKIRFTGGEPLLYPDLVALVSGCATLGISDLALTTNGLKLADLAEPLRRSGLQRVNVSLDSRDGEGFRRMTGGTVRPVLEGIRAANRAGLKLKINSVILRGINDDSFLDLLEFGVDEKIPIRFLELMPIGPSAFRFDSLYVSGAEMMEKIGRHLRLKELPYRWGETSRDYRVHWPDGRESVCGFILPTSTPFCAGCRRLRLGPDGALLGCLAQPDRLDLSAEFDAAEEGDFFPLQERIAEAMLVKRQPRRFRDQPAMIQIGG